MKHAVTTVPAEGREQAPPVVLLHGMGLGRWIWARTQAALARAGITSHAYDWPGHGDVPGNPTLDEALGAVVDALREHPDAALVGHSAGGYLAAVAATRAKVRALALVAAYPPAPVRSIPTRTQLRTAWKHVPRAVLGRPFTVPYDDFAKSGLDALGEEAARAAYARIGAWPGRFVRALAFQPHAVERAAIGAPVLVVIGHKDRVVRWQTGRALGEHLDALTWRYDDLGHFPMLEPAGARFDDDLAAWVKAPRGRKIKP